jgi:hypothetical protein
MENNIFYKKERKVFIIKKNNAQEWLPFIDILQNGIIKVNELEYCKIIKVKPININLKSELEKEVILNNYKVFLQSNEINFQILIQSKRKKLENHIKYLKEAEQELYIASLKEEYIRYLEKIKNEYNLSMKEFFIIISYFEEINDSISEKGMKKLLNDYKKIEIGLLACGNDCEEINDKQEVKEILYSFFNNRLNEIL